MAGALTAALCSGVFVDPIQHVLVLATPVEIVLLGVAFQASRVPPPTAGRAAEVAGTGAGPVASDELQLLPTQLSVPSDNVSMLCIAGTASGRIFLGGSDGYIYEVQYRAEESWFSRRCRKIRHGGLLSSLATSLFRLAQGDAIVQLIVDHERNILYALSERGHVEVYDLGLDGQQYAFVARHTSVASEVARMNPRGSLDLSSNRVVHVAVVREAESRIITLVGITAAGARVYFTVFERSQRDPAAARAATDRRRPALLDVVHVRYAPSAASVAVRDAAAASPTAASAMAAEAGASAAGADATLMGAAAAMRAAALAALPQSPGLSKVSMAAYSGNVMMTAAMLNDDMDGVVLACADLASMGQRDRRAGRFMELVSAVSVEGRVWAMAEASPQTAAGSGGSAARGVPVALHELAQQHRVAARQFMLLTSTSVHFITKLRPVDLLHAALMASRSLDSEAIRSFFLAYGPEQACAICLILACTPVHEISPLGGVPQRTAAIPNGVHQHVLAPVPLSAAQSATGAAVAGTGGNSTAVLAAQCFFHYGGQPSLLTSSLEPSAPAWSVGPAVAATAAVPATAPVMAAAAPAAPGGGAVGRALPMLPDVAHSYAHNALYLYLGRLVADWWSRVLLVRPEPGHGAAPGPWRLAPSAAELAVLELRLQRLEAFMQQHPVFFTAFALGTAQMMPQAPNVRQLVEYQRRTKQEEAVRREKVSLAASAQLVRHTIEVVGFCRLLGTCNLAQVLDALSAEARQWFAGATLRDLVAAPDAAVLTRQLVAALMACCADDPASMDAMSERLRQRCPTLFGQDDTTRFKAMELLQRARRASNAAERTELARQASELFCRVPLSVDLQKVAEEFILLRYYEGVLNVALARAELLDPQHLSLAYYRAGEPATDAHGRSVLLTRMRCYDVILAALDDLYELGGARARGSVDALSARPPLTLAELDQLRERTLQLALASRDELFHVALYRWHVERGITDQLLELRTPYLEAFLKREASLEPNAIREGLGAAGLESDEQVAHKQTRLMLTLQWQYYVRSGDYRSAALVLCQLAELRGCVAAPAAVVRVARTADGSDRRRSALRRRRRDATLDQRLAYLSRAVSSLKSCAPYASGPAVGELLHELEDKLEVAQIQSGIYHELADTGPAAGVPAHAVQTALEELDSELMNITDLYERYAARFNLFESSLAVMRAANYSDAQLIAQLWHGIIQRSMRAGWRSCAGCRRR